MVVDLKRRTAAETITEFRFDRTEALDELARKIARWAQDNVDVVGAADPAMPSGIINRAADNWRPLLAIADAVGGRWPDRARKACVAGNLDAGDDLIETLIGDIAAIFDDLGRDRISSAHLIEKLCDIPNGLVLPKRAVSLRRDNGEFVVSSWPLSSRPANLELIGHVVSNLVASDGNSGAASWGVRNNRAPEPQGGASPA